MIEMNDICKSFRVSRRGAGMSAAVKALFRREYEEVRALEHVSFQVGNGEMVGYIGPNGAGKSTTIKVMSGILTPDSGVCRIDGRVPWENRTAHVAHIGVVFGQRSQLWWDVPVIDSFELLRDVYRVPQEQYARAKDELIETLHLQQIIRTPVRQLSLGQRIRCEIAAALLHNPDILFLDEPTIGLDAVSKLAVRDFILRQNRNHGTTVILTTHDMQDVEALTSRILLIGKGRILLDGQLETIREQYLPKKTLVVSYRGTLGTLPPGARLREAREGHAVIEIDATKLEIGALIAALSASVELTDLTVSGGSTEELVLQLYQDYAI